MQNEDQQKFVENLAWFNQFFDGLYQLFEKAAKLLSGNDWPDKRPLYYYPRSNFKPAIPPYYMMGIGLSGYAIQIFAILDPSLINSRSGFKTEISLIVVKHSREDKFGYVDEYGLNVIQHRSIQSASHKNNLFSGMILKHNTYFHAFQVPLDVFTEGRNMDNVIQAQIVEPTLQLLDWEE